jgi:hypothetical protein
MSDKIHLLKALKRSKSQAAFGKSQTCNMVSWLEYSIWLCALRARMPGFYLSSQNPNFVWHNDKPYMGWSLYTRIDLSLRKRYMTRKIHLWERWSQKRSDRKRSDLNLSVAFKSFSTIYTRHTKQVFRFSSANQAVKQATCRIHLSKGGAKNEIYVFDYRRREKFALH